MKIKTVAAVGAMGLGLGFASFIGGTGTASAACNQATTPPLERVTCLTNADLAAFANSVDPFVAADTFLNGTDTTEGGVTTNDGLGVLDQPATFVDSIVGEGGFLSGPISSQEQP